MTIKREEIIRQWFNMWLCKSDWGITKLFAVDAVYTECWGPEYHGLRNIVLWFRDWNSRGEVIDGDIERFFHDGDYSVVLWFFKCRMFNGSSVYFEGASVVQWNEDGKIQKLKEFGSATERYDPYELEEQRLFKIVEQYLF